MYAQFRAQYPMGSLISELLNIHEGKYIVRASIQVGGSTLATGLSAAQTIEQAEDQARSRALVVLGIEAVQPYSTQAHLMHLDTEERGHRTTPARLSPPTSADFLPLNEVSFQRALEADWHSSEPSALFHSPEQLSWLEAAPQLPPDPPAASYAGRSPQPPDPNSELRQRPSRLAQPSADESRDYRMTAPVDLSDVIAQTDVELKRLGWTHVQGRRHLEKTYRKRSRQHLTDSELIEFLDYLKAQPISARPA